MNTTTKYYEAIAAGKAFKDVLTSSLIDYAAQQIDAATEASTNIKVIDTLERHLSVGSPALPNHGLREQFQLERDAALEDSQRARDAARILLGGVSPDQPH